MTKRTRKQEMQMRDQRTGSGSMGDCVEEAYQCLHLLRNYCEGLIREGKTGRIHWGSAEVNPKVLLYLASFAEATPCLPRCKTVY